jgi:hypothetical protein
MPRDFLSRPAFSSFLLRAHGKKKYDLSRERMTQILIPKTVFWIFSLTHFPACSDDPAGNLSSVGNQNLVKGWLLQICEQEVP